jgi:hypothetical protein
MEVNGFTSIKENEVTAKENKDYDSSFFHHEFVPQGQTVNQEFDISLLECMRMALEHRRLVLCASAQWTSLLTMQDQNY